MAVNAQYFCDVFSFLKSVVPSRAQTVDNGQVSTIPLMITSFDVCREYIFFGSNIGLVYGFQRGLEITSNPHAKLILTNQSINCIKFATFLPKTVSGSTQQQPPNTLIASTDKQVLLYSLVRDNLLTEETILKEDDGIITTISFYNGMIALGTSHGEVYLFEVIVAPNGGCLLKNELVFREEDVPSQTKSNHIFHSIVQIDFHPQDKTLLISSCFRTTIVCIEEASQVKETTKSIQVGQNKRKACGPFGAIFFPVSVSTNGVKSGSFSTSCPTTDLTSCIFAARPSSHLLRADASTGQAQETFILKKSRRPLPKEAFLSLKISSGRLSNVSTVTSHSLHLGKLVKLTDTMMCSYTDDSLVIMSNTGALLLEENDLVNITGVAKVSQKSKNVKRGSEFEVFVLFENRVIVRLRNFELPSSSMTSLRQKSSSSISMSENTFMTPNLFGLPLLTNLVSTLQSSNVINLSLVSKKESSLGDDIEKSTFSENSPRHSTIPLSIVNQDDGSPIVLRRRRNSRMKGSKRPLSHRQEPRTSEEMIRSASSSNSISSPLVTSRTSVLSAGCTSSSSGSTGSECDVVDDGSSKLRHILDKYKQEISKNEESTTVKDELISVTNGMEDPLGSTNVSDEPCVAADAVKEDVNKDTFSLTTDSKPPVDQTKKNLFDLTGCYSLLDINDNQRKKTEFLDRTVEVNMGEVMDIKWTLRISKAENSNIDKPPFDADNIIAISSFNDDMTDGTGVLVQETYDAFVYVYPGYKKIKCPSSREKVRSFGINIRQILLLYDDGSLYRCLDWNNKYRNMFTCLLPLKFVKLSVSRIARPLSLSFNCIDQLCWTCDEDGLGWIIKTRSGNTTPPCLLARDDSFPPVRLTAVSVSPRNSAIVWATDSCGRLFVREGVFNEKGDEDNLIAGINWVRVCDIPFSVKTAVASNDSVWILSDFPSGDRLFQRKGINPPFDYIGTHWQEYQLPASTSFSCLSG